MFASAQATTLKPTHEAKQKLSILTGSCQWTKNGLTSLTTAIAVDIVNCPLFYSMSMCNWPWVSKEKTRGGEKRHLRFFMCVMTLLLTHGVASVRPTTSLRCVNVHRVATQLEKSTDPYLKPSGTRHLAVTKWCHFESQLHFKSTLNMGIKLLWVSEFKPWHFSCS